VAFLFVLCFVSTSIDLVLSLGYIYIRMKYSDVGKLTKSELPKVFLHSIAAQPVWAMLTRAVP
jgi:hypothetical protein